MTSFSPEWLALREPADLAARNRHVLAACRRAFADRKELSICDLGAGTGASVRALADLLPARQYWTLVDADSGNLAAALSQLTTWADEATGGADLLLLRKGPRELAVRTLVRDLADKPACWPEACDLITASALFDLTSARWIETLVVEASARKISLLGMLTFDGKIALDPPHPLDGAVSAAFCAHQHRDKGFGPAAGPQAAAILESCLKRAGYDITAGDSPWIIDNQSAALLRATLEGVGVAVQEMQSLGTDEVEAWLRFRAAATDALSIGHGDVFATMLTDT